MKVLQRKVLTLITIITFLEMKCIETIGWHSVTNGFGVPQGGNKIQKYAKIIGFSLSVLVQLEK